MAFKKLAKNEELEKFKNEPNIINGTNIDSDTHSDIHIDIHNDMPWKKYNKNAVKPKKQFILKLNEYYHSTLQYLSNPEEGISMQKIINEILIPELDKKIREIESNK